jgi:hypothetical protein
MSDLRAFSFSSNNSRAQANDSVFAVDELEKKTGLDIPIHVDGASGAFIAPFAYPTYKWAFDVKRVHSINTSGHKFGASVYFAILIGLIFDVQLILRVCRSGVRGPGLDSVEGRVDAA